MKRQFLIGAIALTVIGGVFALSAAQNRVGGQTAPQPVTVTRDAIALIFPTEGNKVQGTVRFTQDGRSVKVVAEITGLEPNSEHGFHIHQFGDMSLGNGTSMGGHYNPRETDHALPDKEMRHAGDLGNIKADSNGRARLERSFSSFSVASMRNSVVGRGVVIHALKDDGGQPTGNAGARIAYGVIGIAKIE